MNKLIIIFFITCITSDSLFAQLTSEQRIQDSVLGWGSIQDIKNVPKVYESHGHTFTVKTQMDMKNVIEWMIKSYIPVGGLGWFKRKFYVDDYSNQPHSYGIDFRVWNVSFSPENLDEKGHFKPIAEEYTSFGVDINTLTGSNSIDYMSSPTQYVFTWQPDGFKASAMDKIENTKMADPRKHPNVNKFLTRITDDECTVYLVPNNTLPLVQVTKGEYLQMAEQGIDRKLLKEKEDLKNKYPNDVKSQNYYYDYTSKDLERYRTDIKKWMEVYKNSLNEPAVVRDMQSNIRSFNIDPFTIDVEAAKLKHYFPVYKITGATLQKCRADKPQWVAVSFPVQTKEDGNQQYELYRAMLEHFNYEYVYNYYFNPDKTKGVAYKPVNESLLNATLDSYRKKGNQAINAKASTSPQQDGAYFFENFSSGNDGSEPANWYFKRTGKHPLVTNIKNQTGKWLQLGYGVPVSPILLKKPLPENFTLEYDVATDADFNGRTGGEVVLALNTRKQTEDGTEALGGDGTRLSIEIASGNEANYNDNNYRGILSVKINSSPSANKQNYSEGIVYEYPLREFTNKKTSVHVAVKVKASVITIFINNKEVAVSTNFKMRYGEKCKTCGLPAGAKFNFISWENSTNDADDLNVYIRNVKITKE